MSDLPPRGLLQQAHARSVSGEHLEVLGKQAASKWATGEHPTLADAVLEQVKEAGLSPEQVKRVVEFANTDAYLTEFKKEGANHRFVDFGRSGPADPAEVLKSLNLGAGARRAGSHRALSPGCPSSLREPVRGGSRSSRQARECVRRAWRGDRGARTPVRR